MRIQHNIAALNSHRQLGTNQSNSAKNLEKLSSGFRINRAGDDAAGLAISEKMRGQIRGLDMASKNAQDGISLIQTAEGALNETHSILQRMRELSVQSANGTYQDEVDRENLNKEVEALKSEIDRIATSTHFNKIQLLDGSIGSGSKVSSKAAIDPTTSVSSSGAVAGGANATALGDTGAGMTASAAIDRVAGSNASYEITFASSGAPTGSQAVTFSYTDADGIARTKTFTVDRGAATTDADIAVKFKEAFEADKDLNKLFSVAVSTSTDKLVITAKGDLAEDRDVTITAFSSATGFGLSKASKQVGVDATLANQTLDLSTAKAGDTVTIGDSTFELVAKGGKAAKGNIAVAFDDKNASNTTNALWRAIKEQNVDGIKATIINDETIKLESNGAKMPTVKIDTTAKADIGIEITSASGSEYDDGGNVAMRGWIFSDAISGGAITIGLADKAGSEFKLDMTISSTGMDAEEIVQTLANKINLSTDLQDDEGKALYHASVEAQGGGKYALIVKATKAADTAYDMTAGSVTTSIGSTHMAIDRTTIEAQIGHAHDRGGSGAKVTIDFSKAKVGDLFSVNGQTYEIVADKDDEVLTSGAQKLVFNDDKAAMAKDLLENSLGSIFTEATEKYKVTQDGAKLTITNAVVGEASVKATAEVGSVGTNGIIEVGGVKVDFGKSNALNGYKINITTGDENKAAIDKDNKAINVILKEGATAEQLKAALKTALSTDDDTDLQALANNVKVTGELTVGTSGSNAASEITFKENLKSGDTITIGDKTYQIGANDSALKDGNVLLQMELDSNGNVTGDAVAKALADIESDQYTATVDGNKLTLTAADGATAEDIKVTVNDNKALTFQIGANGSADQRVSLNVEDMSANGIGVSGIDVLTADTANSAIDAVDKAINYVSSTRADLGALQNRLEHTVNNLGTTSENLTAAESRIRDVDMAKEMMEFTKNNILTQAAQAMLAQANQQPQGVLQLLQ